MNFIDPCEHLVNLIEREKVNKLLQIEAFFWIVRFSTCAILNWSNENLALI